MNNQPNLLPDDFEPDSWTVVCGRGRECYGNYGNRRLRVLVDMNLELYRSTKSKCEKTKIVLSIVKTIRSSATGSSGFVKQDISTGSWYEVEEFVAREKVGQLLREIQTKTDPERLRKRKERRKELRQEKRMSSTSSVSLDDSITSKNEEQKNDLISDQQVGTPSQMQKIASNTGKMCLTTDINLPDNSTQRFKLNEDAPWSNQQLKNALSGNPDFKKGVQYFGNCYTRQRKKANINMQLLNAGLLSQSDNLRNLAFQS